MVVLVSLVVLCTICFLFIIYLPCGIFFFCDQLSVIVYLNVPDKIHPTDPNVHPSASTEARYRACKSRTRKRGWGQLVHILHVNV